MTEIAPVTDPLDRWEIDYVCPESHEEVEIRMRRKRFRWWSRQTRGFFTVRGRAGDWRYFSTGLRPDRELAAELDRVLALAHWQLRSVGEED